MREFDEIEYEDPGYPVFKAYIVPYRDKGEIKLIRRLEVKDINTWRELLQELRRFISNSLDFARSIGNFDETEEIELICDLIALFFRLPLIREALPTVAPNPLKLYLFCRLIGAERLFTEEEFKDPLEFTRKGYSEEITKRFEKLSAIEVVSDVQVCERIEQCWFALPSDTRPSFNTSGLIPHLLLSSALAWALAVNRGLDRNRVAMLRLATMLHDVGKPFSYSRHIEASVKAVEALLGQSVISDKIKGFILQHHSEADTEEARILSEADRISASIDRLKKLSQKLIGKDIVAIANELGLNAEHAYGAGPNGWKFWRTLSERKEGAVEELSKGFVEKLIEKLERYSKLVEDYDEETVSGVELALIDIGGIQSFVYRSEELRNIVAASVVIDSMVMAQIPTLLQKRIRDRENIWLPYEAILYSAGGIVELVVPSKLSGLIEEVCNRISTIPARFASTPFKTNYAQNKLDLAERIEAKKFSIKDAENEIDKGYGKEVRNLCELCYTTPPAPGQLIKTPEGAKKVCRVCKQLYEIGGDLHFKRRYSSEIYIGLTKYIPKEIFELDWDKASQKIIELISGHDKEELNGLESAKGNVKLRNIGIIKLDGNLMGPFMATSISPSDAYERSARIDLALKKAIEHALQKLFDGIREISNDDKEAARATLSVKLGLMYAGGDDSLIFEPSWCTPVLALILAKEFSANLGNARGLSVGLVAAPAKASIWALISAASRLIDEAKDKSREMPSSNTICFDVVESGTLSESSAEVRLEALREELLTSQPLYIDGDGKSFEKLLSILLEEPTGYYEAFGRSYLLSRFPDFYPGGFKDQVKRLQNRAKGIRSNIGKVLSVSRSKIGAVRYVPIATRLYIRRQMERLKEEEDAVALYRALWELTPSTLNEYSLFSDMDRLIKIVGGGVL
ncbi:MAG: Cas10/Cmr2 second palm domain-containing protein [Thermoproteota archaeon]